jgi:photosystem II stability/assembly factor-like uncharacterized protein
MSLIAVALIVGVGASAYYLKPRLSAPSPGAVVAKRSFPVQRIGDLVRYQFLTAELGWAVDVSSSALLANTAGSFWIFRTIDSARHWHLELFGQTANYSATFVSLQFVDSVHGFVLGADPLDLFRTDDGGLHWSKAGLPTIDVASIQFVSATRGWATVSAANDMPNPHVGLFETGDGGLSWTALPPPPPTASEFPVFVDDTEGWVGSRDSRGAHVYLTTDGGQTWASRAVEDTRMSGTVFTDVRPLPGDGVEVLVLPEATTAPPLVVTTFDRGFSWLPVYVPVVGDTGPIQFQDKFDWWIVSGLYLYKTIDGGRSWNEFAQVPVLQLINVVDAKHAWAALQLPYGTGLALTSDAGMTWKPVTVPIPGQTQ